MTLRLEPPAVAAAIFMVGHIIVKVDGAGHIEVGDGAGRIEGGDGHVEGGTKTQYSNCRNVRTNNKHKPKALIIKHYSSAIATT